MTNEQRKTFWDTLSTLSGDNLTEDIQKLQEVIHFPRYLFRYREVNSNTLDALRTNKMYFSTSNYYDDPFDTFLNIDMDVVKRDIESNFNSIDNLELNIKTFKDVVGNSLNSLLNINSIEDFNSKKVSKILSLGFLDNFFTSLGELRNELKKDAWSVCFSENGFNETLWLKYANQHKGFVLMYDMLAEEKSLCGKSENCIQCGMNKCSTPLYPVYYSDKKYDATEYSKFIAMKKFNEKFSGLDLINRFYHSSTSLTWERERITLIKKKCHEHDEEWRMITGCIMEPPIIRKWLPSGVILGLRMSMAEENLVIRMAQEVGVDKIYKSFINKAGDLDAKQIL